MLDNKKADTYLYQTSLYVTLYRLGNIYNYFYSCLPISTSCLNSFDLKYIDNRDFVLQFPTPSSNGLIPSYNNHPKIIDAFDKNYKYSKQLDIFTSSDINKKVASGKISDIIKLDETLANNNLFEIAKNTKLLNDDEIKIIYEAYSLFDKYLESDQVVLIHNDLHFDNIFVNDEKIKIIDFERSMYAPKDFELHILYYMIRQPWKHANEECEEYTKVEDYVNIMSYVEKYNPEIINTPYLYKRLAIYDLIYELSHFVKYLEHYDELKEAVIENAKKIILEDVNNG